MRYLSLKNGYWFHYLYPFFLCLLFSIQLSANPLPTEQLSVATPTEQNTDSFLSIQYATPELSVRLIDQYQPALEEHIESWYRWEKKRLLLLLELGRWAQITERIESYQQNLFTLPIKMLDR